MDEQIAAWTIGPDCIDNRDRSCIDVCPVDCIHPTAEELEEAQAAAEAGEENFWAEDTHRMVYIDPDDCIACGACDPVCPFQAIYPGGAVPDSLLDFIEINRRMAHARPDVSDVEGGDLEERDAILDLVDDLAAQLLEEGHAIPAPDGGNEYE